MRLAFLTLLGYNLFFDSVVVVATNVNFLEDRANIEDLTAAYNFLSDDKKFSDLGSVLTPDVTFDPGTGPVKGIPATIDAILVIIPNTTITYFTLGTQLITFRPPFDKYGRSNLAESVSYSTFVAYGTGNLTGQYFIADARFVDKEIVRTNQPGFGGWRFRNRKLEVIVSFCFYFFNPDRLPPPPPHLPIPILKKNNDLCHPPHFTLMLFYHRPPFHPPSSPYIIFIVIPKKREEYYGKNKQ